MQIITFKQTKNLSKLSIALGAFDGLHIGHMALLNALKKAQGKSAVLTFEPLPAEYFGTAKRLFTKREKIEAFERAGIDILCVAEFNQAFISISSKEYEKMIADYFRPSTVVAGYNYTYGKNAKGNADSLIRAGKDFGFDVKIIPPVIFAGQAVSATRIRNCIETGDVISAASLLGRPYSISGEIGCGRGIGGRKLGFPTANICVDSLKSVPKNGVYSVNINHDKKTYKGVCNIGLNPTVSEGNINKSIEIHILSLSKDIYNDSITVHFLKRLRDEKKFNNIDDLRTQIQKDIKSV